jgi:hypothetical protein
MLISKRMYSHHHPVVIGKKNPNMITYLLLRTNVVRAIGPWQVEYACNLRHVLPPGSGHIGILRGIVAAKGPARCTETSHIHVRLRCRVSPSFSIALYDRPDLFSDSSNCRIYLTLHNPLRFPFTRRRRRRRRVAPPPVPSAPSPKKFACARDC